jgi:CHAT domain-containing protein
MRDEAFNLKAMQDALGRGRYPLVHIASHFSFRPGNNTKSFLVLGDGDQLTLDKIGKSAVPFFEGVQLLTLSACNTATGDRANGSEVENFAVLAQLKGAQAVLATLWSVRDESTRDLMLRFYKNRVGSPGITKAEALRQAQLSLLRGETNATTKRRKSGSPLSNTDSTGRFSHPYYWAPFILIGNWR